MKRISITPNTTFIDAYNNFIISKTAQGLSSKTLNNYRRMPKTLSPYMDVSIPMNELNQDHIQYVISQLRERNLSANSIASYVRILNVFLSWARAENLTVLIIPRYKAAETVKETYTDIELLKLLKKPNFNQCSFPEYRTWVIINFLMNSGARASTIRNIQIRDVDLNNGIITYRHNKNNRIQIIPLCSQMIMILKEYLSIRNGEPQDYLFCTETGDMLTECGLRNSIIRYNLRRGVSKTSIHLFRHTFAKKYLIDCGGDAFTLQRLLGHSTLEMTKHYCNIYNVDLVKNYDSFSPLQKLKPTEKRLTLK